MQTGDGNEEKGQRVNMAIIREITQVEARTPSNQTETQCRCCVGGGMLQISTYGSPDRECQGVASQTLVFDANALRHLRRIMDNHNLGKIQEK